MEPRLTQPELKWTTAEAVRETLRARREIAGEVREETFKRIEADSSFEPRKYLRLISRDPHTSD